MNLKQKKLQSKICIWLFAIILVIPSVAWVSIKYLSPDLYRELNYDLGENREKEMLENDNINENIKEMESYVSDRAPFRSIVIDYCQKIDTRLDKAYQEGVSPFLVSVFYGRDLDEKNADVVEIADYFDEPAPVYKDEPKEHVHNYIVKEQVKPTYTSAGIDTYVCEGCGDSYEQFVGKLIDESYFPPVEYQNCVLRGRYDWLFYTGNESIDYYQGTNILDEEKMTEYAGLVNRLQELCDERGIQLALMFMPNKEQVYPEYMPTYEIVDEYKRTARLTDYLRENTNTTVVYPLEELRAADVYHQVYYKYDTHWNHFGAIVGLLSLNKAMGRFYVNPITLEGYESPAEMSGSFKLAGLNYEDYEQDVEFIPAYKMHIGVEEYEYDSNLNKIASTYGSNERLVMLGDSFRVCMMPFMARDYTQSTFAHRDRVGDVADEIRNCHVLVISAVERYDSQVFSCIEGAISILEKE